MKNDLNYEEIIKKDIFDLMGVSEMPDDQKKSLYEKILVTIQNRVIARVADSLTDEDMQKWEEIKKLNDQKKLNDFLISKGIDINKLFMQEALIYKTELAQLSQPIRDAKKKIEHKEE